MNHQELNPQPSGLRHSDSINYPTACPFLLCSKRLYEMYFIGRYCLIIPIVIFSSIYFKKSHDSVRRELLYNILAEFEIPMKLVELVKIYLNETY
jgi:hypothetical protein